MVCGLFMVLTLYYFHRILQFFYNFVYLISQDPKITVTESQGQVKFFEVKKVRLLDKYRAKSESVRRGFKGFFGVSRYSCENIPSLLRQWLAIEVNLYYVSLAVTCQWCHKTEMKWKRFCHFAIKLFCSFAACNFRASLVRRISLIRKKAIPIS